mmetsp:Transcript_39204/g.110818  ORF Transcript_39204/g.110818 Transcript_39204/m.110818 type:complete len:565 (+) Transcript_39204:61-1755(+)
MLHDQGGPRARPMSRVPLVDVVVLNRDACPDRLAAFKGRNAEFIHQFVASGFCAQRARDGTRTAGRGPKETLVQEFLGTAAVAHDALWHRLAGADLPLLVLQDDVQVLPGFLTKFAEVCAMFPEGGWHVINLGWELNSEVSFADPSMEQYGVQFSMCMQQRGAGAHGRSSPEQPPQDEGLARGGVGHMLVPTSQPSGAGAYIVSPECARALLRMIPPTEGRTYATLGRHLRSVRGWAVLPPLVLSNVAPASLGAAPARPPAAVAAAGAADRKELTAATSDSPARDLSSSACEDNDGGGGGGSHSSTARARLGLAGDAAGPGSRTYIPEEPSKPVRWVVVGGQGSGGVIVRTEWILTSSVVGRISHGAVILQVKRDNGRIYYTKVEGEGPACGWVSVDYNGKEMLRLESVVSAQKQAQKENEWRTEFERRRRINKIQKQIEEETGRRAQTTWTHEPEMLEITEEGGPPSPQRSDGRAASSGGSAGNDPSTEELYEMMWEASQAAPAGDPAEDPAEDEFERKLREAEEELRRIKEEEKEMAMQCCADVAGDAGMIELRYARTHGGA